MRALAIVVIIALSATAHADRKTAERYFRAGEKAYKAQNFDAAAENFDRAYEAFPAPEIAFSAAQAHRRQYRVETRPLVAAEHAKRAVALYRAYLAKVNKGGRVADAADSLGEMLRELDRLGISEKSAAPTAEREARRTALGITVVFADQTAAATLQEIDETETETQRVTTTIDGKAVPPDELVEIEPGEHVVRAEADGYLPAERRIKVIKDTEDFENLELQPKPARVAIETEPGARIVVDGRPSGTTPIAALELAAGTHVITVARRGRRPVAKEITVVRGEQRTLKLALDKTTRRRVVPPVLITSAGLGVLSLAGVVPYLYFDNRADELAGELAAGNQPRSVLADYNRAIDRRDMMTGFIWVTGGAALAVAGAGAALYYFDTPSVEGARVTPIVTPGGAGAVISGSF